MPGVDAQLLNSKLEELTEQVHNLNTEVTTLRRRLDRVQRRLIDTARPSPGESDSAASREPTEAGWDHVDSEGEHTRGTVSRSRTSRASSGAATPLPVPTPPTPAETSQPLPSGSQPVPSGYSPSPTPTPGGQSVPNWIQRENIAEQIGQFLQRALRGDHRSSSGRDLIPLPSRIWLVCQDIHGGRYNPVRVLRSWQATKALVKIGNEAGDSIFVGLPSEREARRAVFAAGLQWPNQEG